MNPKTLNKPKIEVSINHQAHMHMTLASQEALSPMTPACSPTSDYHSDSLKYELISIYRSWDNKIDPKIDLGYKILH